MSDSLFKKIGEAGKPALQGGLAGEFARGSARREKVDLGEVRRVAIESGFVQEQRTPERHGRDGRAYKYARAEEVAVINTSVRIEVQDWNKFVEWCRRERYSYREGFKKLMGEIPQI